MGRSGKLPSGVSAKLKRWKKGHSSDSNPTISRHRQAARSRFFSRPSGSGAAGAGPDGAGPASDTRPIGPGSGHAGSGHRDTEGPFSLAAAPTSASVPGGLSVRGAGAPCLVLSVRR